MKRKSKIVYLLFAAVAPVALACFALTRTANAGSVCDDTAYGSSALPHDASCANANSAFGWATLFDNNTGQSNTAAGVQALDHNDTGSENTAVGSEALFNNINGLENTATGSNALFGAENSSGSYNTADGVNSLYSETTGTYNAATGFQALYSNSTGSNNTADGAYALSGNTTGGYNTANGYLAIGGRNTGNFNTASGFGALFGNTTGSLNTAVGISALNHNQTASRNTAMGAAALALNTTGFENTTSGFETLLNNTTGTYNTAMGAAALKNNTIGNANVALGTNAGSNLTTGNLNICIGTNVFGLAGESNTTRIGNVYASVATARPVYVNADNKIGTLSSSRRFKEEIKPMDKASEAILALKPVCFRYKKEIDPAATRSYGLIAEEVAEVSPDLITRDEEGKPQTVRYEAVNAMLLNEFLKEHKKVEAQQTTIAELKSAVAQQLKAMEVLTARLKEQAAQIQKVSGRVEMSQSARHLVSRD